MKPAIVMPISDPNGLMFRHFAQILPKLKVLFGFAIVSIPAETARKQTEYVKWLESDSFFNVVFLHEGMPVGQEFLTLYRYAAHSCHPQQILHLCFIDRVAFALQSEHREQFCDDIQRTDTGSTPLIFQRSAAAWQTHPKNYYQLEQLVTQLGELLFGQTLDFAWCHLAVEAQDLLRILPEVKNSTLAMIAVMILLLRDNIKTREVDWLAWEDPFIFERDALELKAERENSLAEIEKRLSYVLPMLQILKDAAV